MKKMKKEFVASEAKANRKLGPSFETSDAFSGGFQHIMNACEDTARNLAVPRILDSFDSSDSWFVTFVIVQPFVSSVSHAKAAKGQEMELLFKEETYQIIGACFEVYNEMGVVTSSQSIRNVCRWN